MAHYTYSFRKDKTAFPMKIRQHSGPLWKGLMGFTLLCALGNGAMAEVAAVSQFGQAHGSGGGGSYAPQFIGNGNSLVFLSHARNLMTNDSGNRSLNLYSYNLADGSYTLVSAGTGGLFANDSSGLATVSSNGQVVVFESAASNLTLNDTNGAKDVFAKDLATGSVTLVSVNTNGTGPGSLQSANPVISADGRWVAFESRSSDLATGLKTGGVSVFLRDRISGTTVEASHFFGQTRGDSHSAVLTPDGKRMAFVNTGDAYGAWPITPGDVYIRQNNSGSIYSTGNYLAANVPRPYACVFPQISNNGQQVLYKVYSYSNGQTYVYFFNNSNYVSTFVATNADLASVPVFSGDAKLVVSENNSNVFLWNLETGTNLLISINATGTGPGNGPSYAPVVSHDFTRIAFLSEATDLVTNVCNGRPQIYVRDLTSGITRLVSLDTNGTGSGDFTGVRPAISPFGDLVAFDSAESNLAPDDRNDQSDIFLYSWSNDALQLLTRAVPGKSNKTGRSISLSGKACLSANGRYVAFNTLDTNAFPVPNTNAFNFMVWDTWQNRNALLDIYTNPPAGNGSGFLNTFIGARPPVLSEDASKLIYVAQDFDNSGATGVGSLISLNLGTGSRVMIAPSREASVGSLAYMSPSTSADGRYVVFQSDATTLSFPIPDTNSQSDVFLYDSVTGTTNLISISTQGTVGNGPSVSPTITPDGKWVFFKSDSSNLSTNFPSSVLKGRQLLYARDVAAGKTHVLLESGQTMMTVGNPVLDSNNRFAFFDASLSTPSAPVPFGVFGFDLVTRRNIFFATNSANPAISGDGRFLAYMKITSFALSDVYVRDLQTGKETLISASFDGTTHANGRCTNVLISPDARYVVFASTASNLVPNDDNGAPDIFVRDRLLGVTTLLTVNRQGTRSASGASFQPVLSRDGRTVVFQSFAGDLVEGDYNNFRDVFVARLGGIDSDGDGMDDDWEVAYFGNLARNGSGDFDGDGQTDLQEFLAGTDPRNDGSILRVMTVSGINSGVVTVLWSAVPGKSYRVQYKDDLGTSGWTNLSGAVTATSTTGSKQDPQASTQRFYRVVVGGE
jgi:Tol biopolymer transport system component